jgi:hypothetical protein
VIRVEPALTANCHPKSPIVWVPTHVADTLPHASGGRELLFPSHNIYLNDVKERAASGVTDRNVAIQACVKRQPGHPKPRPVRRQGWTSRAGSPQIRP